MSHFESQLEDLDRVFRPKILRYMARLVDAAEVEDLTQLAFIKIARGLTNFRGDSSMATWIYRIATNVALDRLRRRSLPVPTSALPPHARAYEDPEDDAFRTVADVEAPSVEAEAIRLEMSECIKQFIDRLPEAYRTVIVLSDVEGFKNQEIAGIVGASLETVKIRLHRARTELRNRLECGCDFYRDERNEFACDRKLASDFVSTPSSVSFLAPGPSTGEKGGIPWSSKIESEH